MVGYAVAVAEATPMQNIQTCHSERRAKNLKLKHDTNFRLCIISTSRFFVGLRMTNPKFFSIPLKEVKPVILREQTNTYLKRAVSATEESPTVQDIKMRQTEIRR